MSGRRPRHSAPRQATEAATSTAYGVWWRNSPPRPRARALTSARHCRRWTIGATARPRAIMLIAETAKSTTGPQNPLIIGEANEEPAGLNSKTDRPPPPWDALA